MINQYLNNDEEFETTLAIGLYHRFKKDKDPAEISEYNQDDPYTFEHFVAKVLESQFGGKAVPTKKSGERGIDIIHSRPEGLFLGQVKCELSKVNYVPVAVLHSQMVKKNAVGGYVISVRDFEKSANDHIDGTNISLIDGKQLVHMWLNPVSAYKKSWLELIFTAIGGQVSIFLSRLKSSITSSIKEIFPNNIGKIK